MSAGGRSKPTVERLRDEASRSTVVLLDYETTNVDARAPSRPLSHAGLVKARVEGKWPRPKQPAT